MEPGNNPSSLTRLSKTSLHALNQGAMITLPFILNALEFTVFKYKPGDEVEIKTEDASTDVFKCRIVDIESVKHNTKSMVSIRVTLEKL